ncbi:MAG: hypothetical protein PHI98_01320 [Eubacteriales bacterium]|nr:hypothetical protein [Eubacteriales bacterium]
MLTAFMQALAFRREQKRLRNSMRELRRNGYNSVIVHGDVTLAQKLHTRLYGRQ